MGRREFSRREFDAMLLGLGGTLFVGVKLNSFFNMVCFAFSFEGVAFWSTIFNLDNSSTIVL